MTVEITLRQVKGAPLTFNEVDDNFSNLKDAADAASGDVSAIDARLTTAEGEIDTLQSNATTLAGRVTAIEADYTTTATTATNVGTFGSASAIPVVTVNAKGLVTAVTTAAIQTGTNITDSNANTVNYLTFTTATTGSVNALNVDSTTTPLTYNPSTNVIGASISGNAATANTATNVSGGSASVTTLTTSGNATLGSGSGNIHVVNGALINERLGSQGALSGFRNRIINGACDIAQRPSVAVPNNISTYGGPDRFMAANVAAGGQFTQSQGSLTFQGVARNSVRQTVNTANTNITGSNFWGGIDQRIEGFNAYDLLSKQVAVSFIFNTNVSGTYSFALRDGAGGQSYVTSITAAANMPQLVKIPVAAIPTATNVPRSNAIGLVVSVGFLNTGIFQTATLNAWQTGNFVTAPGATNWGATAGNFIELTELQLEEGSVATPFERRSYGAELALCQRYYEQGANASVQSYQIAGGTFFTDTPFLVQKRAAPTTLLSNFFNLNTGNATFTSSEPQKFRAQAAATATGYAFSTFTFTASAEL